MRREFVDSKIAEQGAVSSVSNRSRHDSLRACSKYAAVARRNEMTDLLETTEDGIAWLTLNRPERLNAFSPAMLQGLGEALQRLGGDAGVGAVVITGAGRGFCAGGDVKTMPSRATQGFEERLEGLRRMHQLPMLLRTLPKVVIAMVNGPAVGAHGELAPV
jgi:2-(1,2-epoxy-1,2-dihydrophenyl)acetyl-CoA isomerase